MKSLEDDDDYLRALLNAIERTDNIFLSYIFDKIVW